MDISKLKKELLSQKSSRFKGNVYHWTQVSFAYNSNKIEGSRLTEEQTEMIYETHSFISKSEESVRLDDLIETTNHFKLFDYMLEHIEDPLSKEMFIRMNVLLKKGTSDESNPRYNVGGFKKVPNIIGLVNVIQTTAPQDVEKELDNLLEDYLEIDNVRIEDIIDFHVRFERIHPFGDGNGRVGRMIMYKECLKHDIVPFVVLDQDKTFYLRGLKEYNRNRTYLIDTCLHEQDIYESVCHQLLDFEIEESKEQELE